MSARFTPAQEARVREIVREEIDADNALRDSRDHAEFVEQQIYQRSLRPGLESKRFGSAADD